jgi:DNA-binding PadR family transcriptional regulator
MGRMRRATRMLDSIEKSGGDTSMDSIMELSLLELRLLLAIISLQQNAYAGSILDEIDKCAQRGQWPGTIYAALDRLEARGLVKKILEDKPSPKRGGKRKFIWGLTKLGRIALTRTLQTIVPFLKAANRSVQSQRIRRTPADRCDGITLGYLDLSMPHKAKHGRKGRRRAVAADFVMTTM